MDIRDSCKMFIVFIMASMVIYTVTIHTGLQKDYDLLLENNILLLEENDKLLSDIKFFKERQYKCDANFRYKCLDGVKVMMEEFPNFLYFLENDYDVEY